jgi:hypothetical protein
MAADSGSRWPAQEFDPLQDSAFLTRPKLRVSSDFEIWLTTAITGVVVFLAALGIQWIIYDRFLHEDGLRLVGSVLSAVMAMMLVQYMRTTARNDRIKEIRRLEAIALVNHHIRNSLQAIAVCCTDEQAAAYVRESVDRIERVLTEVLPSVERPEQSAAAGSKH